MKKIVMICTLAFALTFAKTCSAMSSDMFMREFSLGGIWIGMPYEELVEHYGEPQRTEGRRTEMVSKTLYYGDSVVISLGFTDSQRDTVIEISVNADNGWTTPSGVHVGMSRSEIYRIYGKPDSLKRPDKKNSFYIDTYKYDERTPAGFWKGRPLEQLTSRRISIYSDSSANQKVRKIVIFKEEYDPTPIPQKNR